MSRASAFAIDSPMTTKLAIFDFDGTLADTYPVAVDCINELALKHAFRQVGPADLHELRQLGAIEVLQALQLPLGRVPVVLADYRRMLRRRIDEVDLFPGVLETLHTMADRDIALALVTSNAIDIVRAVVGRSLFSRFAAVECGASLFGKSVRLRRALAVTRIDRSQAMYIGDEIRDAQAARRAGIAFGAVAWGYTELQVLLRQDPREVFRVSPDLLHLACTRHHDSAK
jgi:phosphoglycolate phosphatase